MRAGVPVAALAGLLAGCVAPVVPPIAARGGDLAFKARIAERFPPGSRADRLRAELLAQGFTIVDDRRARLATAFYAPDNLPCDSLTRIDWREDRRGRIAVIQASRQGCT